VNSAKSSRGTPPYKMGRDCEDRDFRLMGPREHPHTRWGEIARSCSVSSISAGCKGNIPIQDGERLRVRRCRRRQRRAREHPHTRWGRDCEFTQRSLGSEPGKGTPPYKMGRDCEIGDRAATHVVAAGTPPYKMGRDCKMEHARTGAEVRNTPIQDGERLRGIQTLDCQIHLVLEHPHTRWGEIARHEAGRQAPAHWGDPHTRWGEIASVGRL
jgi:hypothetical protein